MLPRRPAAREWVWHTKPATLQKSTHLEKEKGIRSAGELGRDIHEYCTCNLGTGRTRGLLSHSNVSSYRRAINKPGVRAGGGALHTSSAGQGPGSRRSRGDPPQAKEAPGSCQSCSGARGSTAASWGCSSSQGFDPGPRLCRCCSPLARALHENPSSSSSSPSWAHSAPSSNARGWGRCFTVVSWELPSWLNPCRGHPDGVVPAMVGRGGAAVPDCPACWSPRPRARCLRLPHVHGLGARAGQRAPTSSRGGLHCPIPCKHTAPSLPRDSPWAYSGELPFFWLIMSKYRSERRKRGYESFSMSP